MSPKEKLIETIRRSPDEEVEKLSSLLSELEQKRLGIDQVIQMLHKSVEASTAGVPEPDYSKTLLERIGGEPEYMISNGNLSGREARRAFISELLQQKYHRSLPEQR